MAQGYVVLDKKKQFIKKENQETPVFLDVEKAKTFRDEVKKNNPDAGPKIHSIEPREVGV